MRISNVLFTLSFIVLILLTPLALLLAPLPALASHTFVQVEYAKSSFPADEFGYTTADRLRISSVVIDYLRGSQPMQAIEDLDVRQATHLQDVKALMTKAFITEIIIVLLLVIALALLCSHTRYRSKAFLAIQRSSQVTIVLLLILSAFFFTSWTESFYRFHAVFFSARSWEFDDNTMLLRLFPDQLWQDAALYYFCGVLILAVVVSLLSGFLRRRV